MFAKSALKLLTRHTLIQSPRYFFSANSEKLKSILQNVAIDVDGKNTNLFDSGLIVGQHIDESTKKVSISLNLNKDYRRIKTLLKNELEASGFNDADITLAPKAKESKFNRKAKLTREKI